MAVESWSDLRAEPTQADAERAGVDLPAGEPSEARTIAPDDVEAALLGALPATGQIVTAPVGAGIRGQGQPLASGRVG